MRVAGFGFRTGATEAALRDALTRAGGETGVSVLATAGNKVAGLRPLATTLGLPVVGIQHADLGDQAVMTHSPRVKGLYGTGCLAEAAALAAAGPGARLLGPRAQSTDGTATAALAESFPP